MLQKVLNIKNVGKFKNFSWNEDALSFAKNTFVYWNNAKWKSTFCAILKSLSINNPDFIIWRKTFWTVWEQNVTLKFDNWNMCFQNNQWNNTDINIKIFDKEYIYKNIYSDDEIDENKQKSIETIILWEKWKKLKEDMKNIELKIQENKTLLTKITKEYNQYFDKSIFSFEEFRNISPDDFPNLDAEIELKNKELKWYKEQHVIKEKINSIRKLLNLDINKNLLKKDLKISHEVLEKHINSHINPEHRDESLKFFELWNNILINDDVCPFCWQDIRDNSKKILEVYNSIFSDEYQELNNYVKDVLFKLSMLNLWKEIQLFKESISPYIDIDFWNNIDNCISVFIGELKNKSKDLTYEINFVKLDELNAEIENIISIINDKLSIYEKKDLSDEIKIKTSEIKKLEIVKKRLEPERNDKCTKYLDLIENNKKLAKKADEKFEELKLYEQEISSWESTKINDILWRMWADFKLSEFSFPETRKWNSKLFWFEFNNANIELKWCENEPNFKNTLSDSDKRMLAFAFFISEIQKIENIEEYLIVFDDPMTSLDIDRKTMTAEIIRDCLKNSDDKLPNQVIILTHENQFYKILCKKFEQETDTKLLKIEENANRNSVFKIFDRNIERQEEYFKDLNKFKDYVDWNISGCDLWKIRIWLEYLIWRKYYLDISKEIVNHWWIVRRYIDNKANDEFKKKLCDIFPNMTHHDQLNYDISETDLQENEKKDIVKKYLEIIEEV